MTSPLIEPSQFIAAVEPLLVRRDAKGLQEMLRVRWTNEQIKSMLYCENVDAQKVACLALALVGYKCCIPRVAEQLRNPDPIVNQMAEHALLSLWLRGGTDEANSVLCRGMKALERRELDRANAYFSQAIDLDPTFSEAYNQRAIVCYLAERYDESIVDCLQAIERMPCHYLAWAGMGHCHAHQGRMDQAVECYEHAIAINPHLETIREAVCEMTRERTS